MFGALVFIIFVPTQYAIQLQLLGGIWIIQTVPAVLLGVYTRWFNDWALLVGWAAVTIAVTAMAAATNFTPTYPLAIDGWTFPGYTALYTLVLTSCWRSCSPRCSMGSARRARTRRSRPNDRA